MKIILIILLAVTSTYVCAQKHTNKNPFNKYEGTTLDSIFPVENILSIKVINFSGKHTLTNAELIHLKAQLKRAKFAGGLRIKPGHILLEIKLKDNAVIKSGFVYASTGEVHFENGVDKFNQRFSGSFLLPTQINFDNYK